MTERPVPYIMEKSSYFDFIWNLKNDKGSRSLALMVLQRDLFVPAISLDYREGMEKEIHETIISSGYRNNDYFIDVIPPRSFVGKKRIKTGVKVMVHGELKEAEQFSPLLSALSESFAMRKLTVFSHKDNRQKIKLLF